MPGILSYGHRPAEYLNKRKEIKVSSQILSQYAGKYKGEQAGTIEIRAMNELLTLTAGKNEVKLFPESD